MRIVLPSKFWLHFQGSQAFQKPFQKVPKRNPKLTKSHLHCCQTHIYLGVFRRFPGPEYCTLLLLQFAAAADPIWQCLEWRVSLLNGTNRYSQSLLITARDLQKRIYDNTSPYPPLCGTLFYACFHAAHRSILTSTRFLQFLARTHMFARTLNATLTPPFMENTRTQMNCNWYCRRQRNRSPICWPQPKHKYNI